MWSPSCFCEDSNFKSEFCFRVQFEIQKWILKLDLYLFQILFKLKINLSLTSLHSSFFISNLLPKHFWFASYFKNLKNFLHSTLPTIHGPLRPVTPGVSRLLISFTEFLYILKGKQNVCSLKIHCRCSLNKIISTNVLFSCSFRLFVCLATSS